jgi:uncharacterized protein
VRALCDANVWLALTLSGHVHQRAAGAWFDGIAEPESVLFCRATQQAYLRLLTNSAVLAPYGLPPLSNEAAWSAYEAIHGDERVTLRIDEPSGLERRWRRLAARPSASPKLWMDTYLAAFAMASGYRMVTTDTAFRQFDGLDLMVLG